MAYRPDSSDLASGEFALHCRGDVRLFCGDADCTPRSKKGRALLAILAAEQRPLSRTKIIDLLWSDRQEEQARASLRTLLADIKSQFNSRFDDLLIVDRERIALGERVRTDLADPALARPAGELFEGLDHIDPVLDEWLRTEREKWAQQRGQMRPASAAENASRTRPIAAGGVKLFVALVAIALAAFALWRWSDTKSADRQSIAVLPLQGVASEPQRIIGEYLVQGVRRDIVTASGARVLGERVSARIGGSTYDPRVVNQLFGADLLLFASVRAFGQQDRIIARLVDARSGSQLWASEYRIDRRQAAETAQAMVRDLAERVRDSLSLGRGSGAVDRWYRGSQGLRLVEARRLILHNRPADALRARSILLEIVSAQPDNVPALAALAEATMQASDHSYVGGTIPSADARQEARAYANRAIRIAPNLADGYAALGASHMETAHAIAPFERAVSLEPGNYLHRTRLGRSLEFQDRYDEAYRQQLEAVALEPLAPLPMINLIRAANQLGLYKEIERHLAAYRQRGADPSDLGYARAYYAFLRDDNVACVRNFRSVPVQDVTPPQRNVLLFCLTALGENRAALRLVADEDSLRKDVLVGDIELIEARVRKLGSDFWKRHYESFGAAELLVKHGRGAVLLDQFDRSYNRIEEFLDEGGFLTLYPHPLIVAFREAGREADARKLRDHLYRTMRSAEVRPGGDQWESYNGASVAMADGQHERAIRLLAACAPTCIFSILQRDVSQTSLFRPLVGNPAFDALIRDYRQMINRQRRELGLANLPLS